MSRIRVPWARIDEVPSGVHARWEEERPRLMAGDPDVRPSVRDMLHLVWELVKLERPDVTLEEIEAQPLSMLFDEDALDAALRRLGPGGDLAERLEPLTRSPGAAGPRDRKKRDRKKRARKGRRR